MRYICWRERFAFQLEIKLLCDSLNDSQTLCGSLGLIHKCLVARRRHRAAEDGSVCAVCGNQVILLPLEQEKQEEEEEEAERHTAARTREGGGRNAVHGDVDGAVGGASEREQ